MRFAFCPDEKYYAGSGMEVPGFSETPSEARGPYRYENAQVNTFSFDYSLFIMIGISPLRQAQGRDFGKK